MQLVQHGNTLECTQHHTFDIAKEGYVNLVTRKLSSTVGDTKEMLNARRHFLDAGLYKPLSNALDTLILSHLIEMQMRSEGSEIAFLDAGCGEGYYLGQLYATLKAHTMIERVHSFGLDISKEAIRMAARRYKNIQFVVADIKERLIFAEETLHLLLNIFAPRNVEEFARVLVPNGLVLVVIPGANHLRQLRNTLSLLNIQENKPQYIVEQYTHYFSLVNTSSLNYTLHLTQEQVTQAVMMTPNYWHLSDEVHARIEGMTGMETEVEFECLVFQKR